MHPHIIFWVSAFVRMLSVLVGATVAWYFWGVTVGLLFALVGMMVLVCVQLHYLLMLSDWLDHPSSARLPDGWGAWTEIFSRLYKLRRGDEKNQAELAEWLARFFYIAILAYIGYGVVSWYQSYLHQAMSIMDSN